MHLPVIVDVTPETPDAMPADRIGGTVNSVQMVDSVDTLSQLLAAVRTAADDSSIAWDRKPETLTGGFWAEMWRVQFRGNDARADMADVYSPMVSAPGVNRSAYRDLVSEYPYAGFRRMLVKAFGRGLRESPLHPMPMVKF